MAKVADYPDLVTHVATGLLFWAGMSCETETKAQSSQ